MPGTLPIDLTQENHTQLKNDIWTLLAGVPDIRELPKDFSQIGFLLKREDTKRKPEDVSEVGVVLLLDDREVGAVWLTPETISGLDETTQEAVEEVAKLVMAHASYTHFNNRPDSGA